MANWYDSIPAPVDANGREVPLDTRELAYEGTVCHVCSIEHYPSSGQWTVNLVDVPLRVNVRACTLPDSWEQLERDAAKDPCGYFGLDRTCSCKWCPAKSDVDNLLMCHVVMARDLMRRAKALAGVADGE